MSPGTATRPYAGISAEQRHRERRERLLEAGLELLGTDGWSATTVRAVCAKAGVTERYFYESFDGRDALLLAVFDSAAEEALGSALRAAAAAPHDAREKARAAIGAIVELIAGDPRKGRVLFIEAMGSEALIKRRLETLGSVAELIGEQARDFYGDDAPSPQDIALTAHALAGAVFELLLAWMRGTLDVPPQRLIDHSTELFVAAAGLKSGDG